MLGQNLQNVVGQVMDFYLAKTYKKVLPKTTRQTSFNLNNTLEKSYKVRTEGTYVLKVSTDESLGGVYYFYMR